MHHQSIKRANTYVAFVAMFALLACEDADLLTAAAKKAADAAAFMDSTSALDAGLPDVEGISDASVLGTEHAWTFIGVHIRTFNMGQCDVHIQRMLVCDSRVVGQQIGALQGALFEGEGTPIVSGSHIAINQQIANVDGLDCETSTAQNASVAIWECM